MVDYYITGGTLKFSKRAYALEMLMQDSDLRTILSLYPEDSKPVKSLDPAGNHVVMNFSGLNKRHKAAGETIKTMAHQLKAKHGAQLTGELSCQSRYELFGMINDMILDFSDNSDTILYTR
jgi:hypothetical protein